ncbi:MAG: hypothetical protein JWN46_4004 [Acidimicrobiales bacterium]|nr:hypothetical protein [Acidimicrobiales bacterium]
MSSLQRRTLAAAVLAAGGVGAAVGRARLLTWGATLEEAAAVLPGDDLLPRAALVATRAITIAAPPEAVWPWLAQLGQGRGGFYSYDVLENVLGCDIHSAKRIVADWQQPHVGDEVRLHPVAALPIVAVEPGRALVLRGSVPIGGSRPPFDFTWAFVVRDGELGTTRLVVRERYDYLRWWTALVVEPTELISFVMSQKMLRGIRDRAEGAHADARRVDIAP